LIYLPETNAISLYLRGHDKGLNELMTQNWESLRLSSLVIAEREYGIIRHRSGRKYRYRFQSLISIIPIEAFNREDAAHYADLRCRLEKQGRGIGPIDTLIAAQALRLGATVVTHNLSEFKRVPKLKVVDWQTPNP
jgi:tRNA(fMet)-specific endonuclease VapC